MWNLELKHLQKLGNSKFTAPRVHYLNVIFGHHQYLFEFPIMVIRKFEIVIRETNPEFSKLNLKIL